MAVADAKQRFSTPNTPHLPCAGSNLDYDAQLGGQVSTRVQLTRKLAEAINGIDLSHVRAGDEIELSPDEAQMLVAEGWAAPVEPADDKPPRRSRRSQSRS